MAGQIDVELPERAQLDAKTRSDAKWFGLNSFWPMSLNAQRQKAGRSLGGASRIVLEEVRIWVIGSFRLRIAA